MSKRKVSRFNKSSHVDSDLETSSSSSSSSSIADVFAEEGVDDHDNQHSASPVQEDVDIPEPKRQKLEIYSESEPKTESSNDNEKEENLNKHVTSPVYTHSDEEQNEDMINLFGESLSSSSSLTTSDSSSSSTSTSTSNFLQSSSKSTFNLMVPENPVTSSVSGTNSTSITSSMNEEKKEAMLLPKPLTRYEFRQENEPPYYKVLSEIKTEKQISAENNDFLDDAMDDLRSSMEKSFSGKSRGCATLEEYIKKYESPLYKLYNDIKSNASELENDELMDRITVELDKVNSMLEKKYQESISFMHPDHTIAKWCTASGIPCHASSNLDVKKCRLHSITKTTGKGSSTRSYTNISWNVPLGNPPLLGLQAKNLLVIGPAGVVGEYCDAYPNGNFGKKYSPKYPGHSKFNITLLEANMDSIYSGSWDERPGKEDLITPHTYTCTGFDKLNEFSSHFLDWAFDVDSFSVNTKKEIFEKSEKNTTTEYESKNGPAKTKKNLTELNELIEKNKKKDFKFGVKPSFSNSDRGVRCIKGHHDIFGYESKEEEEKHKTMPYQPLTELDKKVYYYPNRLQRETKPDGTISTEALKRVYAIPLIRKDCPLYRAVTYEEYLQDRSNGLVDKAYKPFKPVSFNESFINTGDVVIPIMELVPDAEKCMLRVVYKAFIYIGEIGRLDFSEKPLTKDDDLSKFFFCATPYCNRQRLLLEHEQIPDAFSLQSAINNLRDILKEEKEYKKPVSATNNSSSSSSSSSSS